jgi:hypothetical protein
MLQFDRVGDAFGGSRLGNAFAQAQKCAHAEQPKERGLARSQPPEIP